MLWLINTVDSRYKSVIPFSINDFSVIINWRNYINHTRETCTITRVSSGLNY